MKNTVLSLLDVIFGNSEPVRKIKVCGVEYDATSSLSVVQVMAEQKGPILREPQVSKVLELGLKPVEPQSDGKRSYFRVYAPSLGFAIPVPNDSYFWR
jgi:hypothetical protein